MTYSGHLVLSLAATLLLSGCIAKDTHDAEAEFITSSRQNEATYRSHFAKTILGADTVVIYVTKFDGISESSPAFESPFGNDSPSIKIYPYQATTGILAEKKLSKPEQVKLLAALSHQIAKPNPSGGAFDHMPMHGIRVYRNNDIIFESTFSWQCQNFAFKYPMGSGWLDTNKELERIFNEMLPIPAAEMERLYAKHPDLRK